MDKLFNLSVNKYTLWFLSKDLETKYDIKIREFGQTQEKIGTISVFCVQTIMAVCQGFQFYYSLQKMGRFKLVVEITLMSIILTCLLVEGLLLYLNKYRLIKGAFFMIGYWLVSCEASTGYTASSFAIVPISLPMITVSIYIGVAYNKSWVISTISTSIGVVYYVIRFLANVQSTLTLQSLTFIIAMLVVEMFAIYIFYYNEICLRKNFFSSHLMEEKKTAIKEILNMVPVPILQMKDGKVTLLNQSLKQILGITRNEDKDIKELRKLEREEKYKEYLSKMKNSDDPNCLSEMLSNLKTEQLTNKILTYEQSKEKLKFRVRAIEFMNLKTKIQIFVLEDLTYIERIQNEIKNKYQKILVASFSHDLLTPINGILGIIETLLFSVREAWLVKKLTVAKHSCQKLTFYVSLLKYYAIIEGNCLSSDNSSFNCIDIINECCTLFAKDIKKKKLEIITNFPSHSLYVTLDKMKYQQIMFALIENAEKHTFKGQIKIEIAKSSDEISFNVIDSGVGIIPTNLTHIFELYECSSQSNELNPQGIGISMYVCKKLAIIMGGDISVNSTLNKGTQFILNFPLSIINKEAHLSMSEVSDPQEEEKEKTSQRNLVVHQRNDSSEVFNIKRLNECECKTYLIVDDDPTNIVVLQEYLKSMKKTYDVAFNGQEAVEKVIEKLESTCCRMYKLIIMDINMPIMDGEEATRVIRKMKGLDISSECFIVGLTAAQIQDQAHKERFLKAGFNDMFCKPISRKQFKDVIDKY